MSFFKDEVIYDYINNTDPKNSDDIVEIALKENRIKYDEISNYYYIYTKELLESYKFNIIDLTSGLCESLNDYLNYTLLVVKDIDYVIIGRKKFDSEGKIILTSDTVCGILIAQKGECTEYPTYWTVRLICNLAEPMCKNYGTKLLGLYMLMLVKMKEKDPINYQKYGVLELAGSYTNLAGYCAYSKLGFIENYDFECEAFNENNLLMTSNVDELTTEDIYNTIRENARFKQNKMTDRSEKTIKRPICLYENTKFKNSIINKLEELRSISLKTKKIYTEESLTAEEKQIMNDILEEDLSESKRLNEERRSTKKDTSKKDTEDLLELRRKLEEEEEKEEKAKKEERELLELLEELKSIGIPKDSEKKIGRRLEVSTERKKEPEIPKDFPIKATKKIYDPVIKKIEKELGLIPTEPPRTTKKKFYPEDEDENYRKLLEELGIEEDGGNKSKKKNSFKKNRKRSIKKSKSRKRSIKKSKSRKRSIKKSKKSKSKRRY
jgi:hypothetical protein